ncbi:MAG TPA: hypothetical protein P5539_16305 [Mesotoga sp.]|jgi:hypothetical protein|nr:hypothetical protein [Mesotoga sp.]
MVDLKIYVKKFLDSYFTGASSNSINSIRSGKIINRIHDYAQDFLVSVGVPDSYIVRDRKCEGYFKQKEQDILVTKSVDNVCKDPEISINVRSQMSSIQKNFDTLFERLVAESVNLHERYEDLTCGYLYLIPTVGLDSAALKKGKVIPKERYNLEKYIDCFLKIAARKSSTDDKYKYEAMGLIIVDIRDDGSFSIVSDLEYVYSLGRVSHEFFLEYRNKFADLNPFQTMNTILNVYDSRKGIGNIVRRIK